MDRAGDQGRADLTENATLASGPPVWPRAGSATQLGVVLFPEAPSVTRNAQIRDRWGVGALAGTAVLLGWHSFPSPADRVWAEDGVVFLQQTANWPVAETLLAPFAGYAHVVPRVIAEAVAQAPVAQWGWLIAVGSALARVGVCVLAFHATAGYVASRPLRYATATVVLTLPAGSTEVLNSIANLHWFALYGAVLAALWTPRSVGGHVVRAVVVSCAVLSDPIAIGVAPVLIARVALRRRAGDWALFGAFTVAAAIQLHVVSGAGRQVVAAMSPAQLLELYAARVGYLSVMGLEPAVRFASRTAAALVVAALAVSLAPGLLRRHQARPLVVACLMASVGLYVAAMLFMPMDPLFTDDTGFMPGYALRYGVAPMLLLLTAVIASCAALADARRLARAVVAPEAAVLTCLYVVGFVFAFRTPAETSVDPWRDQVATASDACRAGAERGILYVDPFAWAMELPCDVLLGPESVVRP